MSKLEEGGIEITALHTTCCATSPSRCTCTSWAMGKRQSSPARFTRHYLRARPPVRRSIRQHSHRIEQIDLDAAAIDKALGYQGKVNGGVYQMNIPRADKIRDEGMEVPDSMGSAIAVNFQPSGGGKCAITGDFVLTATEVNPLIKALRGSGIEHEDPAMSAVEVTALHNHMLND